MTAGLLSTINPNKVKSKMKETKHKNKEKFSVLYLDDDTDNLISFKYQFQEAYIIFVTDSIDEAIKLLAENSINVIISDQRMPKMTGTAFFESISPKFPLTPRIILTGFSDIQAVIDGINKGKIYHYLQKPWKEEELKMVIDKAIEVNILEIENEKLKYDLLEKNKSLIKTNAELQKVNHNLVKAKEKAEENNNLKTAFLHNLSHEIRTPMNGIMGFANLISNKDLKEEKRTSYAKLIVDNSKRLLLIIDDILDISRIETGQVQLLYELVDINMAILNLLTFFEQSAIQRGLSLYTHTPLTKEESTILTDNTKLIQILNNLLSNALKYTKSGHIKFGYNFIESEKDDNFLEFFVEDTGIGIPREKQDIIFERFRQIGDNISGMESGTGLGLSICKGFINCMGGKIWVESKPGFGSTFYFTIPYIVAQNNYDISHIDNPSVNKCTVLIVEDDWANFIYLKKIVESSASKDVNIIHAEKGEDAIEYCKNNRNIQLVLMDIILSGKDGYVATKEIKKIRPDLPVIVQTAYATEDEMKKAYDAGCNNYYSKPIKSADIKKIVKEYI